jgi:stress response protein YsnF
MTPVTDAYTWQGRDLLGSDGEKIGSVKEIYEDERTGKPEWALVTTGLFGSRSHFVPLAGAEPTGEHVRVRVSKDQVKDAPSISEGELSEQEERQLFEHYGVPYTDEGSVTAEGAPRSDPGDGSAGHDTSGPDTGDAMTRSEEELRIGKAQHETGRARLRKYVVSEQVQTTVPVEREEVRVEREPITDVNRDQALDARRSPRKSTR